jgi:Mg2+ and Co2+ transporter CorA
MKASSQKKKEGRRFKLTSTDDKLDRIIELLREISAKLDTIQNAIYSTA